MSTRIADGRKSYLFNNLDEVSSLASRLPRTYQDQERKSVSANPLGNLDRMPGAFAFRF